MARNEDRVNVELKFDMEDMQRALRSALEAQAEAIKREAMRVGKPVMLTYSSDNTSDLPPLVGRQFVFVQGRDGRPQAIPADYISEPEKPAERRPSVAETMNDPAFIKACKLAGLEPSRRQAAKFRRQQGQAFKTTLEGQMARVDDIPEKRAPRAGDDEEV